MAKKENNEGCFSIFVVFFVGIISYSLLQSIFNVTPLILLIAATGLGVLVMIKWLGVPTGKTIVTSGAVLIFLFLVLKGINFLLQLTHTSSLTDSSFANSKVERVFYFENQDSIAVFESFHQWKDNYGTRHQTKLAVREKDYKNLAGHISTYNPPDYKNFWGNLYKYIDMRDAPSLDLVVDAFETINKSKKLNQMEFAEMVVSCIQNIPYSFVFTETCMPAGNYEDSIKVLLEQCPECCIGNMAYGIQNPVSFFKNLKGDCDTRTVLIYSILKHFNYDVAIVNSDFYQHSILGIHIPATGYFKNYKGKKYYLWETTAAYFPVGELSSTFNDTNHWNVVLTSK